MKSLLEIKSILQSNKPYLQEKYKIKELGIFGSQAREKSTGKSDIDILIEFKESPGLKFVDLADELEELLGKKVDLVSKNGVKSKYLKQIEEDLVNV